MQSPTVTQKFDFEAMRRAIEQNDADALGAFYTDDAELRIVDNTRPPSAPEELRGRAAIAAHWRDVCGRNMTHRVEREVIGANRVAFVEACTYPEGNQVLCATTLDFADGKVTRQLIIQAWDE